MAAFKTTVYLLCILLLICGSGVAQHRSDLNIILGKVIDLDRELFGKEFYAKINDRSNRYLYSQFHIIVVNANNDTLLLSYVFNITREIKEARSSFGIRIDSIYQFVVAAFTPCDSDFPRMLGCRENIEGGKKGRRKFTPAKNSICKTPYESIYRIIEFTQIDKGLWERVVN